MRLVLSQQQLPAHACEVKGAVGSELGLSSHLLKKDADKVSMMAGTVHLPAT